jgi:hypothetical protein
VSHSERRKSANAVKGGTDEENSEGSLILLVNSADFDSAIRRFDPSRPSQLILLAKSSLFVASFGNEAIRYPVVDSNESRTQQSM